MGKHSINYAPPPVNKKLIKPPIPLGKPKVPDPDALPDKLAWVDVKRNKFPHMEPTVCCDQGCRINDIIILVPVKKATIVIGCTLVHVGCLRTFMEEVPEVMSVVKERVNEIKGQFIFE